MSSISLPTVQSSSESSLPDSSLPSSTRVTVSAAVLATSSSSSSRRSRPSSPFISSVNTVLPPSSPTSSSSRARDSLSARLQGTRTPSSSISLHESFVTRVYLPHSLGGGYLTLLCHLSDESAVIIENVLHQVLKKRPACGVPDASEFGLIAERDEVPEDEAPVLGRQDTLHLLNFAQGRAMRLVGLGEKQHTRLRVRLSDEHGGGHISLPYRPGMNVQEVLERALVICQTKRQHSSTSDALLFCITLGPSAPAIDPMTPLSSFPLETEFYLLNVARKAGWLKKKGQRMGAWKRYYVSTRTQDGAVAYSNEEKADFPLGFIAFDKILACTLLHLRQFVIVTESRDYQFKAKTAQSAASWVQAINHGRGYHAPQQVSCSPLHTDSAVLTPERQREEPLDLKMAFAGFPKNLLAKLVPLFEQRSDSHFEQHKDLCRLLVRLVLRSSVNGDSDVASPHPSPHASPHSSPRASWIPGGPLSSPGKSPPLKIGKLSRTKFEEIVSDWVDSPEFLLAFADLDSAATALTLPLIWAGLQKRYHDRTLTPGKLAGLQARRPLEPATLFSVTEKGTVGSARSSASARLSPIVSQSSLANLDQELEQSDQDVVVKEGSPLPPVDQQEDSDGEQHLATATSSRSSRSVFSRPARLLTKLLPRADAIATDSTDISEERRSWHSSITSRKSFASEDKPQASPRRSPRSPLSRLREMTRHSRTQTGSTELADVLKINTTLEPLQLPWSALGTRSPVNTMADAHLPWTAMGNRSSRLSSDWEEDAQHWTHQSRHRCKDCKMATHEFTQLICDMHPSCVDKLTLNILLAMLVTPVSSFELRIGDAEDGCSLNWEGEKLQEVLIQGASFFMYHEKVAREVHLSFDPDYKSAGAFVWAIPGTNEQVTRSQRLSMDHLTEVSVGECCEQSELADVTLCLSLKSSIGQNFAFVATSADSMKDWLSGIRYLVSSRHKVLVKKQSDKLRGSRWVVQNAAVFSVFNKPVYNGALWPAVYHAARIASPQPRLNVLREISGIILPNALNRQSLFRVQRWFAVVCSVMNDSDPAGYVKEKVFKFTMLTVSTMQYHSFASEFDSEMTPFFPHTLLTTFSHSITRSLRGPALYKMPRTILSSMVSELASEHNLLLVGKLDNIVFLLVLIKEFVFAVPTEQDPAKPLRRPTRKSVIGHARHQSRAMPVSEAQDLSKECWSLLATARQFKEFRSLLQGLLERNEVLAPLLFPPAFQGQGVHWEDANLKEDVGLLKDTLELLDRWHFAQRKVDKPLPELTPTDVKEMHKNQKKDDDADFDSYFGVLCPEDKASVRLIRAWFVPFFRDAVTFLSIIQTRVGVLSPEKVGDYVRQFLSCANGQRGKVFSRSKGSHRRSPNGRRSLSAR